MRLFIPLSLLFLLSSCSLIDRGTSYDDERNPFIKQALQDLEANKEKDAVSDYECALQANPKLGSVHEALGYLYAEKLNDPVSSIFHFKRYLEIEPDSPKLVHIKAIMEKESEIFAAASPNSPAQNADAFAKLQSDMSAMRSQLETTTQKLLESQQQVVDLKQQVLDLKTAAAAQPTPAPQPGMVQLAPRPRIITPPPLPMPSVEPGVLVTQSNQAVAANPVNPVATAAVPSDPNDPNAAATGAARTYTVVPGDSLWKIAHKMYKGNTKEGIDKIRDANKDSDKPLHPGQVLTIP